MTLVPENLQTGDVETQGPRPLRIEPDKHGGAQSRKFATVASALTLEVGTPVAWNEAVDAFQAWDPNTGLPAAVNEVQHLTKAAAVDGGTFKFVFKGIASGAIAYNADAATMQTALLLVSTIGSGNATITGTGPFVITFIGALAGAPQPLLVIDSTLLLDGTDSAGGFTVTGVTTGAAGGDRAEVQTLTIAGTPTGGTFTLTFDGQTTDAIDYDATAAEVETAFEALSNVGADNGTCSGGPLPGSTVVITFSGDLDNSNQPLVYADASGLTGGTNVTAIVSQTTEGGSSLGADAPAGTIAGFVHPSEIVLSTAGEVYGVIMMKGSIHHDDVELPVTGSPTQAQLDEALREGLLAKGLLVTGMSGVH